MPEVERIVNDKPNMAQAENSDSKSSYANHKIPMVKFVSADGKSFNVEEEVARKFKFAHATIKCAIKDEEPISLETIDSGILTIMIKWAERHVNDLEIDSDFDDNDYPKRTEDIDEWDNEHLNLDAETLCLLIGAARYREMKGLLNVALKKFADMIKDDVRKARIEIKVEESESELITEEEEYPLKRKRKQHKNSDFCYDEESSNDQSHSNDVRRLKTSKLSNNTVHQNGFLGPESSVLSNIARTLMEIERRIAGIEKTEKEILEKLNFNHSTAFGELPSELKLPCDSVEDVNKLEDWLLSEENLKALMVNLSVVGGNTTPNTVRRILQKLFTNRVAVGFNWTGKHQKCALKDLKITKMIPRSVRGNKCSADATDEEIYQVMTNWFRFSKSRDEYLRTKNSNNV